MATKKVEVQGLAELQKMLQAFPVNIEKNVMQGGLRAGLRVMQVEARALAPVDDGDLRKSIRIKSNRKAQKRGFARMDLIAGDKTAWYSHLIEFGTASFYTGNGKSVRKPYKIKPKKGKKGLTVGGKVVRSVVHPGIRPQPFMRPVVDTKSEQALKAFADYLRARIPKEIEKAKK